MTLQGQKYKLKNPNKEEKSYFDRTFGCVRKVFNKALDYAKNQYEEHGNSTNYYDWSKYLTALKKSPEYAYLKDVSAVPLVETLRVDLTNAFKNFFKSKKGKKGKKGKYGYPKFKKYSDLPSATFKPNAFTYNPDTQEIKLAKMQKPLRVIMHRPLPGKPKQVTLSRDSLGDYYISCLVEKAYEKLPATGNITGIDLGCRKESLVTFSDGKKIPNPKYADKFAKDIAHLQRIMAKKQKGSGRYKKLKLQVAELKKKEARCRAHHTHNVSKQMVENYDVVSMETLRPSNMVKNKKLARSIQDANWSELQRQIEYKAERRGRKVVKVDRWFPSSQLCSNSNCGEKYNEKKQGSKWKEKHLDEWTCVNCGTHHDRDINAAINILNEGKKKI